MPNIEIRKQISIFLPVSDWRVLRAAAAERKIPITELCREWIYPELRQLRRERRVESAIEHQG